MNAKDYHKLLKTWAGIITFNNVNHPLLSSIEYTCRRCAGSRIICDDHGNEMCCIDCTLCFDCHDLRKVNFLECHTHPRLCLPNPSTTTKDD